MTWGPEMAAWWSDEVSSDPAYRRDVDSLLDRMLPEERRGPLLDVGCGDGRLLGAFGHVGVDSSHELAQSAAASGASVAVGDATDLPFAEGAFPGAYAVLVVEHVADLGAFFRSVGRVVSPGGFLVLVLNHPLFTAPGSGPFVDPEDGELLWRWGSYLGEGWTDEPAGDRVVRFHHRPLSLLLTAAAATGWILELLVEAGLGAHDDPLLATQRDVPRLLGARWRKTGPTT